MTQPSIPEPIVRSDRGFLTYAGGPIPTDYGHDINVYESSAAFGPHVWLSVVDSPRVEGRNAHLTLRQAVLLRGALDQFIQGVPERWEHGAELLANAEAGIDDGGAA
jgi:hypothetical protein